MARNLDWYPATLAARIAWHANFAAQAALSGTSLGLTAGQVTQIAVDADTVATLVNFVNAVDTFSQACTAWRRIILDGGLHAPLPDPPAALEVPELALTAQASIQARTRQYAGLIKASLAYTAEQGERYGVVGPGSPGLSTPALVATALTGSQISLAVSKGGAAVVALDSRRGGGAWEPIGISMMATYIDARPALVPGSPEVREYRGQAMANNVRVGALSAIASAVTVP